MKLLLMVIGLGLVGSSLATTVVVYDTEPETKTVALGSGDILEVRGNGLTANCSVTVTSDYNTPATIRFYENATVAAALAINDSVNFKVEDGKTVTVSSKLTATASHNDAIIKVTSGSGSLLKFTGGGKLDGRGLYTSFRVAAGEVEITDNDFETTYSLSFLGGHLTLKNGADWAVGTKDGSGLVMGRGEQSTDAIFEIGEGCTANFGNNQHVYLGCASGKTSKLYINGGTLNLTTVDRLFLNYTTGNAASGAGNAILEIDNGGVINSKRCLTVGSTDPAKAKIILGNGTWKGLTTQYLVDHNAKSKSVACDFYLKGDFKFDCSTFLNYQHFTDARPDSGDSKAIVRWFVPSEGATLRLNGKYASAADSAFTIHNLSTEYPLALGLNETNGSCLNLTNAAENLKLAATLPLREYTYVTASGTSPSATVDLTYASSSATPVAMSSGLLSAFRGFSGVELGSRLTVATAAGGQFFVPPEIAGGLTEMKVSSGTLVLKNGDSIPSGVKVETSGDGALALVNQAGFVAADKMSGTRQTTDIAGSLTVTDTARTGEVTVGDGETLYVYGDGLGADSSVKMQSGSALTFMATATIAGTVTSTNGTTTIATAAGATGTLAGKYVNTSADTATIKLKSEGLLNFIGGGEIASGNNGSASHSYTYMDVDGSGAVQITNKPFKAGCTLNFFNGKVRLADGGNWTASAQYAHIGLDRQQRGDVCFEIGEGASVKLGNNCFYILGNNSYTTYASRVFVNGGTLIREGADPTYLRGNACLEVDNGGRLAMSRYISSESTTGNAKVILKDGSWDGYNEYSGKNSYDCLFKQTNAGTGSCTVSLEGDFTIDMQHYSYVYLSNTVMNAAVWTAKPGARLRVVGDPNGIYTRTLAFHNFNGEGLAIDLNPTVNTDVAFYGDGSPISVGFVVPGINKTSRLLSKGVASPLNVEYVIPALREYSLTDTTVYESALNFSSVTHTNLTFDAGSTMVFPYASGAEPTAIAGTLTLPAAPGAMNYRVVKTGTVGKLDAATVVTADRVVGNPVWTCAGGLVADRAEMAVDDNALKLSYSPTGLILLVK